MNPNRWNLFMKKLTRARVVPIISASVSCEILGRTLSGPSILAYCGSNRSVRARRFSLELNSWSTRSSSIRMLRASMCVMNRSDSAGCRCSRRTIRTLSTWRMLLAVIAVALPIRTDCPARHPSPKKSPGLIIPTTASRPVGESTESFTPPFRPDEHAPFGGKPKVADDHLPVEQQRRKAERRAGRGENRRKEAEPDRDVAEEHRVIAEAARREAEGFRVLAEEARETRDRY